MSSMRNFTPIPSPPTTPRISARKDIEKIARDQRVFMVTFWSFFNELGEWRDNIEKRLTTLEHRFPHQQD